MNIYWGIHYVLLTNKVNTILPRRRGVIYQEVSSVDVLTRMEKLYRQKDKDKRLVIGIGSDYGKKIKHVYVVASKDPT